MYRISGKHVFILTLLFLIYMFSILKVNLDYSITFYYRKPSDLGYSSTAATELELAPSQVGDNKHEPTINSFSLTHAGKINLTAINQEKIGNLNICL